MRIAFALATAFAAGCTLFVDAGGLSTASESAGPPDGSVALDAGVDAPSSSDGSGDATTSLDAADAGCPGTAGPAMVRVTDMNGSFCVDSTEVTNRHMNAFIMSLVRPTAPAACSFKATYGGAVRPDDDLPVTQVDWCDAWMYCAWAGKRLCGSRNGTVIDDFPPASDAKVSEWFAACSRSGTRQYPYAGDFDPNACNGCNRTASCSDGGSPVLPVGTLSTCAGGFDGIFDMSGNVAEWEDNCNADTCPPRGGNVSHSTSDLTCAISEISGVSARSDKSARVGIRCCATPN